MGAAMTLVDRIDEFGRGGWIAITVLSFVIFWPFGFVVLGFLLGSGRMGCWHHTTGDRWQRRMDRMQRGFDRAQEGLQRAQAAAERWYGRHQGNSGYRSGPSGNHAFDEYRAETLRRLEEEEREFREFLDRLRHAKDKAEFDQFMAERRAYRDAPPSAPSA
jgi:hypothetical protein